MAGKAKGAAAQAKTMPRITAAAVLAGHEPRVERAGARFSLVCTCGWRTPTNYSRKRAFQAVTDHVYEAGREQIEAQAQVLRDTPLPANFDGTVWDTR